MRAMFCLLKIPSLLLWSLILIIFIIHMEPCQAIPTALRKSNNTVGLVCLNVRRQNYKGRRSSSSKKRKKRNNNIINFIGETSKLNGVGDSNSNSSIQFPTPVNNPDDDKNSAKIYPLLRPVKRRPFVQVSLIVKMKKLNMSYFAGETQVNSTWLNPGRHKLEYRHTVHDKKHKLRVFLDGEESPFEFSKIREPLAEYFEPSQVWIKLQGPVIFANKSCVDSSKDGKGSAPTSPTQTVLIDTEAPPIVNDEDASDKIDDSRKSSINDNILDEQTLRNESITQKILLNSRLYNSNISYSYIQNSRLFGSKVMNSVVLNTVLFNTTAYNCTLKNTTLHHSEVINGTYDDIFVTSLNENNSLKFEDSELNNNINVTMLVFGTLGSIVLVMVITIGSLLSVRFIIKRRKGRLLVRSAVMGDIRSW